MVDMSPMFLPNTGISDYSGENFCGLHIDDGESTDSSKFSYGGHDKDTSICGHCKTK